MNFVTERSIPSLADQSGAEYRIWYEKGTGYSWIRNISSLLIYGNQCINFFHQAKLIL